MRNSLSPNSQFLLVLEGSSGRVNVRQPVHLLREVSPDPLIRTELTTGTQQRDIFFVVGRDPIYCWVVEDGNAMAKTETGL